MDDDFASFAGGKLKLKKVGDGVESSSKKRKRRDKERRQLESRAPRLQQTLGESLGESLEPPGSPQEPPGSPQEPPGSPQEPPGSPQEGGEGHSRSYTKAELAYKKQHERMQTERIKQKAQKTHKQRVEEFNRHLDNLTEHFDIPKVSWTK